MELMRLFFVLIAGLLLIKDSAALNATLHLLAYHPATFNLTFDEQIPLPRFQILLNNQNLSYVVRTNKTKSCDFLFQITQDTESRVSDLQIYTLRFNQPLDMGGVSQLQLDQFILRPLNASLQQTDLHWIAILICILTFSASLIDTVGLWLVDLVQVYVMLQINSSYPTQLDEHTARYLLLEFPVMRTGEIDSYSIIPQMGIPIALVLLSFLIGVIFRLFVKEPKSWGMKIARQFFTYHFFISMGYLFTFNFTINSIGFIMYSKKFMGSGYTIGIIFSYIGLYLLLFFLFSTIVAINPMKSEGKAQFQDRQTSSQYSMFSKLYNGLYIQKWITRNFHVFLLAKKTIIAVVCCFAHDFYYVALAFQITHLFYIFTIKPYKYDFYTYLGIITQSMTVIFYFYLFESDLYFKMSGEIITHQDILAFMISRSTIFGAIFLILIAGNFYECYQRLIAVRNEFKSLQSADQLVKTPKQQQLPQMSNRFHTQSNETDRSLHDKNNSKNWNNKSLLESIGQKHASE